MNSIQKTIILILVCCIALSCVYVFAEEPSSDASLQDISESNNTLPVIEYDSKACALEILFPQEIAKRAIIIPMKNYSADVGEDDIVKRQPIKYDDEEAFSVYIGGKWVAADYDTWKVSNFVLKSQDDDSLMCGEYEIQFTPEELIIKSARVIILSQSEYNAFGGDSLNIGSIDTLLKTAITVSPDKNSSYLSVSPELTGLVIPEFLLP